MVYSLTIGLEIHCKLLTDSKVFCRCRNEQDFDTLPANTHICPVCTGQPGALPTLSKDSIQKAAALGMLLGCEQQASSHFDRKSYFYPDLPMGYQITQFNKPLNIKGKVLYHSLDYSETLYATITQAHLECDTAKTATVNGEILLDFNRAWTPLVEIVTDPAFHSADEVHAFIREMQRTLTYYNISLAEMDKWQMRCDVNISISNSDELWTKVEIKNMNSISAIKKAIAYEYTRQSQLLDAWGKIDQETRWRDESTNKSYVMRSKENALDYRYFPEPDLPPVVFSAEDAARAKETIWEPIAAKIERYKTSYWFNKEYINWVLTDSAVTHIFETCVASWHDPKVVAKYLVNYVLAYTNIGTLHISHTPFSTDAFMEFLWSISTQNLSDNIAKQVITLYLETWKPIQECIDTFISAQPHEIDLPQIVSTIIQDNQKVVDEYKAGKKTAIWFLIWQVMKKTWGAVQPQAVQKLFEDILDA